MTCQHCHTWVLDDDHRCRRCGRRLRSTPSHISASSYPVTATATARAYDFYSHEETEPAVVQSSSAAAQQQSLFVAAPESRVIPFDTLSAVHRPPQARSDASRASGPTVFPREYASPEMSRPAPLTTERVEVRRARSSRTGQANQRHLELFGNEEVLSQPESTIICDAPVAPASLRMQAGLIDLALMAGGCVVAAVAFRLCSGAGFALDKHSMPFVAAALITIPLFYRFLWAFVGLDSMGMCISGLRLVDFDGNPPSQKHRFQRIIGSIISVLAAGMGLIWSFVDQDRLSWHDHISGTFPTIIAED